ncbi:MAG: hypothetical protein PHF64_09175, partial [Methanoregula sp.]|nr:hypothetical protein [Methanoregula sp.]
NRAQRTSDWMKNRCGSFPKNRIAAWVGSPPLRTSSFSSAVFIDIGDAGKIAYFVVGKVPAL